MRLALGLLLGALIIALSGCGGCTCYSYDPVNSTVYPGLPTSSTTAVVSTSATTTPPPPPPPSSTTVASIVIDLPTTASTEFPETTTSTMLSSAETQLASGRVKAMGLIKKVWESDGKRYISIDYVDYFTGDAATKAALEDGAIRPGGTLDHGYYIRNTNQMLREFEVSPSALITTNSWEYMDRGVTWKQFKSFWGSPPAGAERLRTHPWVIEREGSVVMDLEEPYLL